MVRKWYWPVTVLGVGGLGAILLSDWGRNLLRSLAQSWRDTPERIQEWNEAAQTELDKIQAALNRLAETLEPQRLPGH